MDYAKKPLNLTISSSEEYFVRRRSCAKEPETVEWLETESREGDVFYDIGANVGAYSLVAAGGETGIRKVYAFEPGFLNYGQLCRNVLLNRLDGTIAPMPIALSDRNGMAEFHFANLSPGAAAQGLLDEGDRTAGGRDGEAVQSVMVTRLDDLRESHGLEAPNLIKIDVDGAEVGVLEGASKTLALPELRSVLVETGADGPERPAVFAALERAGFRLRSEHAHKAVNYIFERA